MDEDKDLQPVEAEEEKQDEEIEEEITEEADAPALAARTIIADRAAMKSDTLEVEYDKVKDGDHEDIAEKEHELSDEDRAIVEKIKQRKAEAEKKKRRTKFKLIFGLTTLAVLITALILSFTPLFAVDSIEVRGNTHYTAEEIISMGHAVPGRNLIYHADKAYIKDYLELNPYIEKAEVKRKLPSTLVIEVKERTQLMALKYDDDYLILDKDGILLQKSRTKPKLTLIIGNVINKIKLGENLGTENADLLRKSVDLVKTMGESDIYYVKVDMSDTDNIKAYIYDTLIVKTDYDSLMENMKNGRLHLVLDKLFEDSIKRGTITFNGDGTASFLPIF